MSAREGDKKPSVVNGRLERVSVSQIKTFKRCKRAWWYAKVAHLPKKPPSKGVLTGLKGHQEIEHWAETGEDVRGKFARAEPDLMKDFVWALPFSGGPGLVETPMTPPLFTEGGVEWVGYIDLYIPPTELGNEPIIIDHKFRKSIEKYAENEEALQVEDQANVYAYWASGVTGADSVTFRHHNHQTEGRLYSKPVEVSILKADAVDRFRSLCETVDGPMQAVAAVKRDIDIDVAEAVNKGSCQAFGGCDFALRCPNSPQRRFALSLVPGAELPVIYAPTDSKEGYTMGLLDAAQAALGTSTPAPAAQVATTPQPATVAAQPAQTAQFADVPGYLFGGVLAADSTEAGELYTDGNARVLKCEAVTPAGVYFSDLAGAPVRLANTTSVRAIVKAEPPASKPPRKMLPVEVPATPAAHPQQILPPDASKAVDSPEALAAFTASMTTQVQTTQTTQTQPELPRPSLAEAAAIVEAEKPKRGPGRPKKGTSESVATGEATVKAAGLDGLILCVNCAPNRDAQDLTAYVSDLAAKVATSVGAPDVRFPTNDAAKAALGFGAWKGALAAAAKMSPPTGLCVIYSGDLADPVIEALSGLASLVVRS